MDQIEKDCDDGAEAKVKWRCYTADFEAEWGPQSLGMQVASCG